MRKWLQFRTLFPLLGIGTLWLFWQLFTDELVGLIRGRISDGGIIMYGVNHPSIIMPGLLVLFCIYALVAYRKRAKSEGDQTSQQRARLIVEPVLAELARLRSAGAGLLNEGLETATSAANREQWWGKVALWRDSVRSQMSRIHAADGGNWETLGTFAPKVFGTVRDPDMNHKLAMLSVWLEKLHKYIDDRTSTQVSGSTVEQMRGQSEQGETAATAGGLSSSDLTYLLEHKGELAVGMAWYGAKDNVLENLCVRRIIQLTQRREALGPRTFDQNYWMLTDLGKQVVVWLEKRKR